MRSMAMASGVLIFCSFCFASGVDEPSSMFRANPQHTGYSAAGVAPHVGFAWFVRTGNKVRSTAAVTNGIAYFGSNDGTLYAIDMKTGATKWRASAGTPVASSPAVAYGLVLFQSGDGVLHAVDVANGTPKWTFQTGPELRFRGGWDYFTSSPVVAGDTIFFGAGDGKVYAVGLADGRQRWAFATQAIVRATPAVNEGTVYAGSMDGNLYALEAQTGALKWKFKTDGNKYFPAGEIQSSPAIKDGVVYFGSRDASLYAIDAKTGEKKWVVTDPDGSWVISSPAIAEGLVVIGSSDGMYVQALDAHTGESKWKEKVAANIFASPLIANGVVYAADWQGKLHWFDLKTGKKLGAVVVDGPVQSSPVFADGLVLFGSDNDEFYALR